MRISRGEQFCVEFVFDNRLGKAFSRCAPELPLLVLSLFLGGRLVLLSGLYRHWTPLWLHRQHEGLSLLHRTLDNWQLSHAVRSLGPFVVVVVVVDGAIPGSAMSGLRFNGELGFFHERKSSIRLSTKEFYT